MTNFSSAKDLEDVMNERKEFGTGTIQLDNNMVWLSKAQHVHSLICVREWMICGYSFTKTPIPGDCALP